MFECYAKTLAAATEYPTSVDKSRTVDKRGQTDRIHQMVERAKRVEVMPELVRGNAGIAWRCFSKYLDVPSRHDLRISEAVSGI
jgi:hypothetical protein